jgi:hypothetical protein
MESAAEIRAWQSRWAVPVGIASILGVVLLVVSGPLNVHGNGAAERLREANLHDGSVLLAGLIQVLAFCLLALPLVYLFRLVQARSPQVRKQLIGLVAVAPVFLAVSAALTIPATNEAADEFVAGDAKSTLTRAEAKDECVEERQDEGADFLVNEYEPSGGESALGACEDRKVEDDEASNAVGEASLAALVSGLGLAGALGFAVALLYSGLWALRTGILSRFWGALAMASGIAFLLGPLFLITLVWFFYFGLLVLGLIPGGRPPAWEAGEAIPWPTPGEKAATELEPSEEASAATELEPSEEPSEPSDEPAEKRKRKQRVEGQSE